MPLNKIRRVLLLKKTSRLAYERSRYTHLSEKEFREKLISNGSDYEGLLQRDSTHETSVKNIYECLRSRGVEVLLRQREDVREDDITSSDMLLAAGGDGNFLTAASHVLSPHKLVIGVNTDPERSVGHLCITPNNSFTIDTIVDSILEHKLKYIYRQRLHVSINGRSIPTLILNEAFIGESDPSQVSYFEMQCCEQIPRKCRNSGLLVYTGTGSTSWAYNTNKLSFTAVQGILALAQERGLMNSTQPYWDNVIREITEAYNESNVYCGSENSCISYVVREPIEKGYLGYSSVGLYSGNCTRLHRLKIRSRSWKTQLIIDGQHSYCFPNGSEALFTLGQQYTLYTASKPD